MKKKLFSLILAFALLLTLLPQAMLPTFATDANREKPIETVCSEDLSVKNIGGRALTDAYLNGYAVSTNAQTTLPSSYDSRDYGYVTSVKDQGGYSLCWAHAAMASIESSMIKNGIINNETGAAATSSMDLSESHLAWFTFTKAYDRLGMLSGDASSPGEREYNKHGLQGTKTTYSIMRWEGPASESESDLKYSNMTSSGLDSKYAYNYDVAHVTDVDWIPACNRQAIKQAIMEYGAGTIDYCHNTTYFNSSTNAYYNPVDTGTNHAVTVVGWDDNYSKTNFKSAYRPSSDGAWIIKNSWGANWGKNGYFYLSYEDVGSSNTTCFFYKVSDVNKYDNCYQYDGTINDRNKVEIKKNSQIGNVFVANSSESLKAVAVSLRDEATTYTLRIYKNPTSATNPSSGTLMTTQTGYLAYPGYHTIPLNNPVSLSSGDKFTVVFTLSTPESTVNVPYDANGTVNLTTGELYYTWIHTNHGNTSFYKEPNGSWTDVPDNGDFRIKAYTDYTSSMPDIIVDEIGTVAYGKAHNITGTVSAKKTLTSVKGEILSGSTVKQSCTVYPNAKTLDLKSSAINANLKFGTLDVGSYTLRITAKNSTGTTTKSIAFTVEPSKITLEEIGVATYGSSHAVIGTVTSSSNLTSVKGEILSGSTVVQSYTVKPNAKTLDLRSSAINTNLKFAKLAVGSYTLKITAVNAKGTATKSISFTVSTNLTISVDEIGNVTYGSSHNIVGTVSSAAKLTSVKGEILYGNTVKQTVTVAPNAKTLNLKTSNINKNLKFGKLAKGAYILRITAVDATGTTKTVSIPFKIV